jgi:hypothetical protein
VQNFAVRGERRYLEGMTYCNNAPLVENPSSPLLLRASAGSDESRPERRIQRSPWASEALRHQLSEASARFAVQQLLLVDTLGHAWARSSGEIEPAELAQMLRAGGFFHGNSRIRTLRHQGTSVTIKPLLVGEAALYLVARGAQRRSRAALQMVTPGVQRILGTLL